MKYIESTQLPDGTYDHTEVRAAAGKGYKIQAFSHYAPFVWFPVDARDFDETYKYRATIPDTYGIHESSSTLREVKGDAGPAIAEMLLDRIKELEDAIDSIRIYGSDTLSGKVGYYDNYSEWLREGITEMVDRARAALNKEPK